MTRLAALCAVFVLAPALFGTMTPNPPQWGTPLLSVAEYSGNTAIAALNDNDAASFGRVFPPTESAAQSGWVRIVVGNGMFGGAPLNMTTPAFTSGGAHFTLDTSSFVTGGVAVGASTEFLVRFSPAATGALAGTIQFDWEIDPVSQPGVWDAFRINVQGQGMAAPAAWLSVREGSPTGDRIFVGQASIGARNLGTRVVTGGPGNSLQVFVVNEGASGAGTINLSAPTLASGSSDLLLNSTGFATSLAPGASTSFTVTFDPSVAGVATAVFEIAHSDSYATAPFAVEFQGYGTATALAMWMADQPGNWWVTGSMVPYYTGTLVPENQAASGSRDFGQVGGTATRTIQLDNGDAGYLDLWMMYFPGQDLILGTPTIIGDPDFTLDLTGFSTTVPSATSTTFVVRFSPQASGTRSAVIEIPHGDTSERAPFRINITGEGVSGGGGSTGTGGGKNGGGSGCSSAPVGSGWLLLVATLGGLIAARRVMRRQ